MDNWLPTWADQYGIISVGVLAVLMGISGVVRHESGALSRDERQTALGRMITPLLSAIWFIIGAILLYTRFIDEPARSETVGYTALIGSITVLTTLILALIYYALPLPNKRSASLDASGAHKMPAAVAVIAAPSFTRPRFRRHDAVLHPDYGRGSVLGCFANDSIEMVAVRFSESVETEFRITSVPAASLTHLPPQ